MKFCMDIHEYKYMWVIQVKFKLYVT